MNDSHNATGVGSPYTLVDPVNSSAPTKRVPLQFRSEEELEAVIEAAKQAMCSAPTREEKIKHWDEMCDLIKQRTPARRRFMARVRGL